MDRRLPLPERMRPRSLDEFVGQKHLVGEGHLLRRLYDDRKLVSLVLWGQPGTGKTTLARLLATRSDARLVELTAVSSGVKDLREVFAVAEQERRLYGVDTVLFVDEIHRFSKAQQDSLLPAVEQAVVRLIGSTTENPRASLTRALQSRLQICQLEPLSDAEVLAAVQFALADAKRGLGAIQCDFEEGVLGMLVQAAGGDLRKALLVLEWAVEGAREGDASAVHVGIEHVRDALLQAGAMDGDRLYDMLSAFGKSLRGSDADAALYWFMAMVHGGIDPRVPTRRLVVHAAEDVGLASPQALVQAVTALTALEAVGWPEARIPLAQAIIFVSESPKSNSVVVALERVETAIARHPHAMVPVHLRDKTFARMDDDVAAYVYPHSVPEHFVLQQYLPAELADTVFYEPGQLGAEARIHPRRLRR
ncbi:MAG: replication-associated recombination protein A [Firmicutes bacterium]|nr:replication-associated recombination protein A [Bacillota bacterium]